MLERMLIGFYFALPFEAEITIAHLI